MSVSPNPDWLSRFGTSAPMGALNLPVPVFLVQRRGKGRSDFQERLIAFVRQACLGETPPSFGVP